MIHTYFVHPQIVKIVYVHPCCPCRVLVQVTPGLNLVGTLPIAQPSEDTLEACEETHVGIFSSHGFDVVMCQYIEETPAGNTSQTTPPVGMVMPSPEESSVTLIVIMVVVGVAVCMALSILTCIFFWKRRFA